MQEEDPEPTPEQMEQLKKAQTRVRGRKQVVDGGRIIKRFQFSASV